MEASRMGYIGLRFKGLGFRIQGVGFREHLWLGLAFRV